VTLFTPGKITTKVKNLNADLSYFENELKLRGDSYISLLRKHPFTFITLSRQVQNELIAKAMRMANDNELDILHVYTNEEETALPFSALCSKPVVFTHHDPFNFLVKYKNFYPKYSQNNWISISLSQRAQMPPDTNWLANIPHGLPTNLYKPSYDTGSDYLVYLGRIISTKGVHLAIDAVQLYNESHERKLTLKIAGKHYADHKKDSYWKEKIEPELADRCIQYIGFVDSAADKQELLAGAKALLVPSLFEEPFGMVAIEALACGTPVIGLDSGALPETIEDGKNGYIAGKVYGKDGELDEHATARGISSQISKLDKINRKNCRLDFEERFTAARMADDHIKVYKSLAKV
ncbi:MAG TPA: glycosyltransferase, partial [Candidatus Saccharimonadales bacterium]|nr:glycosyltransferase [Candidatus Saccharimonadales bacterium]